MNTKLLIIIYSLLIISILSSRVLREEEDENPIRNENDNDSQNEEKDEIENNDKEETDFSKISSLKIRKENMPHSRVLLPIRRIGTSNMQMGEGPCGDVEKKPSNTLTTKGSIINFIWEIIVPENSGNCTVKISKGMQKEDNFELLKPVDGETFSDGSFICGREKGFENKDFILPENYECDGCTLQWKWSTSYGDLYSCSDIIINGGSLSKCMGKCLNGGSCFNGECICLDGFEGDFCENKIGQPSWAWFKFLLGVVILVLIVLLGYKFKDKIKNWHKSTMAWTTSGDKKVDFPFNEDKKKEDALDSNQLQPNSSY